MTISLKKFLMDMLYDMPHVATGSVSSIDALTKQVTELTEENLKLKKLYLKTNVDIAAMQTIIKSIAHNQAQLAADMHTVYSSVRDAGIMDTDYSESESMIKSDSDEDDDPSSGNGGMGGMLN